MTEAFWAIGLMSGTSLDGIDAALIKSDGRKIVEVGPAITLPYDPAFRQKLYDALGHKEDVPTLTQDLTHRHAEAVSRLQSIAPGIEPEVIGFHGQTLFHDPTNRYTLQIGDGALLARLTGINVVNDFRAADVKAGGQGAPLVPIYHAALAEGLSKPLAILNIGGVANVTWIGPDNELLAFDTGPGNALIDDWVKQGKAGNFDAGGQIAVKGVIDAGVLAGYLSHSFFDRPAPKSLDRNEWPLPKSLSLEDGAATLAAFTAAAIELAQDWFPQPVTRFLVAGGGRHNRFLMRLLNERLEADVQSIDLLGWNGDFIEAQAFGFLAIRAVMNLPLTFPGTTGVAKPLGGGVIHVVGRH